MSVAAIYPAFGCSPRAAGLDEIRGSVPNQSLELFGSLLQAGLADPGPTWCAITSFIALATEGELAVPRSRRQSGVCCGCIHRHLIVQPLCSSVGTTSPSRPVSRDSAARGAGQGRPCGPPRQRLGLAGYKPGATLALVGGPAFRVRHLPTPGRGAGRSRRASSPPKRSAPSYWPAPRSRHSPADAPTAC